MTIQITISTIIYIISIALTILIACLTGKSNTGEYKGGGSSIGYGVGKSIEGMFSMIDGLIKLIVVIVLLSVETIIFLLWKIYNT